jgi:hypothetical protein
MTGDKENIRSITYNWDKFVEIDFTTHTRQKKTVTFFHLHNFNLSKVVTSNTNMPQSQKLHQSHITNPNLKKLTTYY